MLKSALKGVVHGVCLILALPAAALSLFGRLEPLFVMFAQCYATLPGVPGDYMRIAFYKLTLRQCSLQSRVSFGSFFAHSEVNLASRVYIGSYCVLGKVTIGQGTQIASGVQILSGRHQHARDAQGQLSGSLPDEFKPIVIGANCWIGAAAIIMADVGRNCTIGAGSIVLQPVPAHSVAVGNPARVIRSTPDAPSMES